MSRGWTYIDDDKLPSEEDQEKQRPFLDSLAQQWSALTEAEEQRGFIRQADFEDGDGYEPETDEEVEAIKANELIRRRLHDAQVSAIEQLLFEKGARMMRPYEHWNEDEERMQYLERDR